jgi:hypothetical protein
MTNDQIEEFLEKTGPECTVVIGFNSHKTLTGIFIQTEDYAVLRSKNLWRIVSESSMEEYGRSKDKNLSRIFSGMEISVLKEPV